MTNQRDFKTKCPMNCYPTLCGLTVSVEDRQLAGIVGDETNPDSQGFLCMRGKAAHEIVGSARRILTPLTRAERVRIFVRFLVKVLQLHKAELAGETPMPSTSNA
ncbi:MAG: anaerobic selenocysteine-containing dehydrogenase [Yoonia sp.]|jgi:anaerobic selenocysteine-containing dehydrogenase